MSFLIYLIMAAALLFIFGIYYGIHFEDEEVKMVERALRRYDEEFEHTKFLAGGKNHEATYSLPPRHGENDQRS